MLNHHLPYRRQFVAWFKHRPAFATQYLPHHLFGRQVAPSDCPADLIQMEVLHPLLVCHHPYQCRLLEVLTVLVPHHSGQHIPTAKATHFGLDTT